MNVNKVILVGNLGNDPQQRTTTSGKAVTSFRLATNETWTDQSGQPQQKVNWHNIVVWGKRAESCARYLGKGRRVYIEGKLENRSYEDKEGITRYVTDIIASEVVFLDYPDKQEKPETKAEAKPEAKAEAKAEKKPTGKKAGKTQPPPVEDENDDNIPF